MVKLLAVSTGRVAPLFVTETGGRIGKVTSAIRKTPVSSLDEPRTVAVQTFGVQGDECANEDVHGGVDKAVYLMPVEHYPFWETQRLQRNLLPHRLPHGFLGENLTISGLLEADVFVGDELLIGEVRLRVTQAREPCFKFNARMGYSHASKHMVQAGCCGWYAKVITPGLLSAGMPILLETGPRRRSIADEFARLNHRAMKPLFPES